MRDNMCYFIHGALLGEVKDDALNRINSRYAMHISKGTKHELKEALQNEDLRFRITDGICDCKSEIGGHDPASAEVAELASLITEVAVLPEAKRLSFCKAWAGNRCKKELTFRLSEAALPHLLAELEADTLYTILLKA